MELYTIATNGVQADTTAPASQPSEALDPFLATLLDATPERYTREEAHPVAEGIARFWMRRYRYIADDIRSAATLGLIEATQSTGDATISDIKRSIKAAIKQTILELTQQPPKDYDRDETRHDTTLSDDRVARLAAYLARCDDATKQYVKMVYGQGIDAKVARQLTALDANAAAQIRRNIAPWVAVARERLYFTPSEKE